MPTSIITTDDLQEFKEDLIAEFSRIFQNQNASPLKKYLKSNEVMELLQISPGTLQTFRINGLLPYTKIGGIIYYDAIEIQNIMEKNKIQHL